MILDKENKLDFDDVLMLPNISHVASRSDVNLKITYSFLHSPRQLNCVPVIAANMDTTGSFTMAETLNKFDMLTCLHKHYSKSELIDFYSKPYNKNVFYSTGISDKDISKMDKVFAKLKDKPNICVDVANGYTNVFSETILNIRKKYPEIIIMAGNIVTPDIITRLAANALVDIIKIGIGPGSVCTTRLKTGIGYPQFSAIVDCVTQARQLGVKICSDGGCKNPGDICKAFGAGADMVMLGGMFAGTDCCEGDWQYEYLCKTVDQKGNFIREWWQTNPPGYHTEKRKTSLKFYGMSSQEAMNKHNGGVAEYRTSEGKCVQIPYKGETKNIAQDILGGLRSCCAYTGSKDLHALIGNAHFIKVNRTHNTVYGVA